MESGYTEVNARVVDAWVASGWQWSVPVDSDTFSAAKDGEWSVLLTPTKAVPKEWFPDLTHCRILGLASGGGQQMPIFAALGAECTVLDYSDRQLMQEISVAERERYRIATVKADMTEPLPFEDRSFDLIFHPVSNCYVKDVIPIWQECYRVLRPDGILMAGLDNGINYVFDDDETMLVGSLPFDPLSDEKLYEKCMRNDWGIQFSHTIEEQVAGQLRAGFLLTDIYQDTNGEGNLHEHNVPTFYATRSIKKAV